MRDLAKRQVSKPSNSPTPSPTSPTRSCRVRRACDADAGSAWFHQPLSALIRRSAPRVAGVALLRKAPAVYRRVCIPVYPYDTGAQVPVIRRSQRAIPRMSVACPSWQERHCRRIVSDAVSRYPRECCFNARPYLSPTLTTTVKRNLIRISNGKRRTTRT